VKIEKRDRFDCIETHVEDGSSGLPLINRCGRIGTFWGVQRERSGLCRKAIRGDKRDEKRDHRENCERPDPSRETHTKTASQGTPTSMKPSKAVEKSEGEMQWQSRLYQGKGKKRSDKIRGLQRRPARGVTGPEQKS